MPTKESNSGILYKISESFRPYVQELWKDINFGLCRSKVDIEKPRHSGGDKNNLADQFTLILPYAGNYLRWEVMFDSTHPYFAPDFRFDDENFLCDVNSEFIEKNVPSLAKWDVKDPKALSNVITELMHLYREHQKILLGRDENSRAYFEYTTLMGDAITPENDVEILVGKGESVNFLIKLNVEHSQLPALFGDEIYENPADECVVMLVKYPNPAKADLIMSPLVTRAVGDITLPPMHNSGVLMDYVPTVTDIINKKITMLFESERLRHEVLSRFIAKYEGGIIEHDTNTASFLFDVKDFYCILQIEIGVNYPERPITFTLRSVYHNYEGKPKVKVLGAYQHDNVEKYIAYEIELFRQECTNAMRSKTEEKVITT